MRKKYKRVGMWDESARDAMYGDLGTGHHQSEIPCPQKLQDHRTVSTATEIRNPWKATESVARRALFGIQSPCPQLSLQRMSFACSGHSLPHPVIDARLPTCFAQCSSSSSVMRLRPDDHQRLLTLHSHQPRNPLSWHHFALFFDLVISDLALLVLLPLRIG